MHLSGLHTDSESKAFGHFLVLKFYMSWENVCQIAYVNDDFVYVFYLNALQTNHDVASII